MKTEKRSVRRGYFSDLPDDLKGKVLEISQLIRNTVDTMMDDEEWKPVKECDYCKGKLLDFCQTPRDGSEVGGVTCWKDGNDKFEVMIQLTGHFYNPLSDETEVRLNKFLCAVFKKVEKEISEKYKMRFNDECDEGHEGFDAYVEGEVAAEIWDRLDHGKMESVITFTDVPARVVGFYGSNRRRTFDDYLESHTPPGDDQVDVVRFTYEASETKKPATKPDTKSMLDVVAQKIMDDLSNGKKITAARVKTCETIINHDFISKWSNYKAIKIEINPKSSRTVEFKIPKLTQDFIGRLVTGRELLSGFLHRDPTIHVKLSADLFETMKKPSDLQNFFKELIQYYDVGTEKAAVSIPNEISKMGHEMEHLVVSTKMYAMVASAIALVFVCDGIDMSKPNFFDPANDDMEAAADFLRSVGARYKSGPKEEQQKILKDFDKMIQSLRESAVEPEIIHNFKLMQESMETYMDGGYLAEQQDAQRLFEHANTDHNWHRNPETGQVKYLQEKFGVKKLKKIPRDIVAYVQIEGEAIKDANDKMMIASYCLGKIEIVEWYIELIDSGSKKYIVPHQKPYLVSLRTQLLAAYKKIMDTPIPKIDQRPIVDIQYPKGYEG